MMFSPLRFWGNTTSKVSNEPDATTFTLHCLKTLCDTWLSAEFSNRKSAGLVTLQNEINGSRIYLCVCLADQVSGYLIEENIEQIDLPGLDLMDQLSPRLLALARQIAGAVQAPARWQPILDGLQAEALSPHVAEAPRSSSSNVVTRCFLQFNELYEIGACEKGAMPTFTAMRAGQG